MRRWKNTSGNVTRLHSRCTSSPVRWRHLHRPHLKWSSSSGHLEGTKNKPIDSSASSRKPFRCPTFSHLKTCRRFSVGIKARARSAKRNGLCIGLLCPSDEQLFRNPAREGLPPIHELPWFECTSTFSTS